MYATIAYYAALCSVNCLRCTILTFSVTFVHHGRADRIKVRAEWHALSISMPGVTVDDAMDRVSASVSSLGDSAAGLITILGASITATAYDLGGTMWLLVHVVEMEQYFILGAGGVISGVALMLGLEYPPGAFMFVSAFCGTVEYTLCTLTDGSVCLTLWS